MEKSQKTLQRLEHLRQLNANRNWVNDQLYRFMYKEDLYVLAYERIKSAPGNLTPGSDGATIDGTSLSMIHTIIEEMRTEQFQFKPARTVYLPKPNGKKRKLGIPSTRDKIVQEVIDVSQNTFRVPLNNGSWPDLVNIASLLQEKQIVTTYSLFPAYKGKSA